MRSRQSSTTSLPSRPNLKNPTTNFVPEGVDDDQDPMDLDDESKPDLSAGVKKRKNEEDEYEMDISSECSSPSPLQHEVKRKKKDDSAPKDKDEHTSVESNPSLRKRPQKKRWINQESEPIYDWTKLPKGWSHLEPDLDDRDVDAQVERCKERIQDGYMPHIFKDRLETLLVAQKRRQETIAAYPAGLDFNVIQRLESLKRIKRHLEEKGDEYEELPNVEAIIEAYLSGTLTWVDGRVTYWSKGKKLGPSTIFDFDKFLKLNYEHKGNKGFWVEGVFGSRPTVNALHTVVVPSQGSSNTANWTYYQNHIHLAVRLASYQPPPPPVPGPMAPAPAVNPTAILPSGLNAAGVVSGAPFPMPLPEFELMFQDDTGADNMQIWNSDLVAITPKPNPAWPLFEFYTPAIVGFNEVFNASGTSTMQLMICLEVNMRAYNPRDLNAFCPYMKTDWTKVFCTVDSHNQGELGAPLTRLGGPWLRHSLYTATAPEDLHELMVSTHKTGLTQVKTVDHTKAKAPHTAVLPRFEALYDNWTGGPVPGRPFGYRAMPLP